MSKTKTFYIAARTSQLERVRALAQQLELRGYQWAFDWTKVTLPENFQEHPETSSTLAQNCVNGAKNADLFILIATNSTGGRGMFIELGVALTGTGNLWIIGDEYPSVFSLHTNVHHALNEASVLALLS
jgi:hypothetical protein